MNKPRTFALPGEWEMSQIQDRKACALTGNPPDADNPPRAVVCREHPSEWARSRVQVWGMKLG
jgi:hypothetical protein